MTKLLIFVLMILNTVGAAQAQKPDPELPRAYVDTTWNQPTGNKWNPHTSADFQAALNTAKPGDTIVLDAGVTYAGDFDIQPKNNPSGKWIYVESSALSKLPAPGSRVGPADAPNMPRIAENLGRSTITLEEGVNYMRFVGLEVTSISQLPAGCPSRDVNYRLHNCLSMNMIDMLHTEHGAPISTSNITIDRCYIHGSPTQDVFMGVQLQAISGAVIDSYISDMHWSTLESYAVHADYTPGPLKVVDNFLSSTGENILFGGNLDQDVPYIFSDLEVRRNHFWNDPAMFSCGDGGTVQPGQSLANGMVCPVCDANHACNQWSVKNHLEFKAGQRAIVTGNMFENIWASGQSGSSILFTPRYRTGIVTVVDDITVQNNVLNNVTKGFATLAFDDGCPGCGTESRNNAIVNNLVLLADGLDTNQHFGMQWAAQLKDTVFQHNTVLSVDGAQCWAASYFVGPGGWPWPPPQSWTNNIWYVDNNICLQPSGDNGAQGTQGLTYYMGDPAPLSPRFWGNLMFVPSRQQIANWTGLPHNDATKTPFTYVDPANGNYQLASPLYTDTTDGTLTGIDWLAIQAAMGEQACPLPSFTPGAGFYRGPQKVTISSPGCSIYYNTTGSPRCDSSTLYSGPVNVVKSETLFAIACKSGFNASDIASPRYLLGGPTAGGNALGY